MRFIRKQGNGGHHLNTAHINPPQDAGQASSRWSSFRHERSLQQALLMEQYWLCCYSELRADELNLGYHIEHVENKSQNPARTFDYTNLAASALHSNALHTLNRGEAFGGHARGKSQGCDMTRFVSCHQVDCARHFAYLSDGRVVPALGLNDAKHDRATYAIDLLNLNSPFLVNLRQHWWEELEDFFAQHEARGWSLNDLIAIEILPVNGKLDRFFTLTRQFFGEHAETVLRQQAPQLP